MPSRNLARLFVADSYYHIYNRGVNKRKIFLEDADYIYFLSLLSRYAGPRPLTDRLGREYKWFKDDISVLAYCLMPNHFHLVVYQKQERVVRDFMLSLGTAYSMYFNKKYHRGGPLFENNYRASLISNDSYLLHISRYIHLNPPSYKNWPFSSYGAYIEKSAAPDWLHPKRLLSQFESIGEYRAFVDDYEDMKHSLALIKSELADS